MNSKFSVFIFIAAIQTAWGSLRSPGNDCEKGWVPYKNEKCIQVFTGQLLSFVKAINFCKDKGSFLLSIKDEEEQKYFNELIFKTYEIKEPVLLGVSKTNGTFHWYDNSPMSYSNWDTITNTSLENDSDNIILNSSFIGLQNNDVIPPCVELTSVGKWKEVSCEQRNGFVCEKKQIWSTYKTQAVFEEFSKEMQTSFQELRKELIDNQNLLAQLRNENSECKSSVEQFRQDQMDSQTLLEQLRKELRDSQNLLQQYRNESLKGETAVQQFRKEQMESQTSLQQFKKEQLENPVPIGFIYVQFGNQPDPQVLWPTVVWKHITNEYAGLFFRAEGLGSSTFGTTQAENSPRLSSVHSTWFRPSSLETTSVNIVNGGTTPWLWTGDDRGGIQEAVHAKFTHTGGEVRPRNQAMRIWKRIN